jgi:hypothetical protein
VQVRGIYRESRERTDSLLFHVAERRKKRSAGRDLLLPTSVFGVDWPVEVTR